MGNKVRVRFAPSPTGGLHLGGVRTILFNYLFARQHAGDFVLRIEDTDLGRYVPGAEAYIMECLQWCGLIPDEGPGLGGPFGPYRQSERREIYPEYARRLVEEGHAYYAFDTQAELEQRRKIEPNFRYSASHNRSLKNSLSLPREEVERLLSLGTSYVIRFRMPEQQTVELEDMIRGRVQFDTSLQDDKVLLKADGMPTYHLAVVVDDYLMRITHVFRGEEWLPSAVVHVLLWSCLFGLDKMPLWAHLPLILKPEGNGKLSKRDGERLGFPVYAMSWKDPSSGALVPGFRELGFLPVAFLNMLAMLGWNDGSSRELFSLEELVERFSIQRVHKAGARFDFEKARWFNQEWIKRLPVSSYLLEVEGIFQEHGVEILNRNRFEGILELVRGRCQVLEDFWTQAGFFFRLPVSYDLDAVLKKWSGEKAAFFRNLGTEFSRLADWLPELIEGAFRNLAQASDLKPGELQLPLRIMLVGGKFGPPVFEIAHLLGQEETLHRIRQALPHFGTGTVS